MAVQVFRGESVSRDIFPPFLVRPTICLVVRLVLDFHWSHTMNLAARCILSRNGYRGLDFPVEVIRYFLLSETLRFLPRPNASVRPLAGIRPA